MISIIIIIYASNNFKLNQVILLPYPTDADFIISNPIFKFHLLHFLFALRKQSKAFLIWSAYSIDRSQWPHYAERGSKNEWRKWFMLSRLYQWENALNFSAWLRHQVETFSALLAICAGNSPVSGEFPAQRPVTRSFDVFFDLRPNKRLSKQWWGWWFETLSRPLWRHDNGIFGL